MRVLSDGRVKRDLGEWRALVAEFESSGLAETEFCRRQELARSTFIKWKRRLASWSEPARSSFVEWPIPGESKGSALDCGEFELSLPGGVVLRWKP